MPWLRTRQQEKIWNSGAAGVANQPNLSVLFVIRHSATALDARLSARAAQAATIPAGRPRKRPASRAAKELKRRALEADESLVDYVTCILANHYNRGARRSNDDQARQTSRDQPKRPSASTRDDHPAYVFRKLDEYFARKWAEEEEPEQQENSKQ
jgi:hypothetical protein